MSSSSIPPLATRSLLTSGFKMLDHLEPIEEERLLNYQAEIYYLAHLARDLVEPDDPGRVSSKIYISNRKIYFSLLAIRFVTRNLKMVNVMIHQAGRSTRTRPFMLHVTCRKVLKGLPLACDFGDAGFGDQEHDDLIMPEPYRAPEVVMQMKWGYAVDISSFGMAWHFVASKPLFSGRDPDTNEHHDGHLIAELGALRGSPPPELMRPSRVCPLFWDENGNWRNLLPMPDITLENLTTENNNGAEERKGFCASCVGSFARYVRSDRVPRISSLIPGCWMVLWLLRTDEQIEHYIRSTGSKRTRNKAKKVPRGQVDLMCDWVLKGVAGLSNIWLHCVRVIWVRWHL
ncbi:hypothetical protein AJ78_02467 [Emergomyces pasteurianus Ep9510]|uniref:Protein kinase domain-containing protein n=1 Tax=Emergomyces pasteurianus Ep9510 TaxID=1447872 RepID=A0A1J9PNI5_9EURO|nr:hypothetical protein AJ78_02467 [Emergomyces pasteurianus Ep9510]